MLLIESPHAVQKISQRWRSEGETIVLVPTMGALHAGHRALLDCAHTHGTKVIASIFVNPLQFSAGEDLDRYPHTLDSDLTVCRAAPVDAVFLPTVAGMYPPGFQTMVDVGGLASHLCGTHRPGHFRGVATVVCRLFNLTCPQVAIFGEKDYQQLQLIRQMVADLGLPVSIVGVPTVRDHDGLALSSRNRYLAPRAREQARAIPAALFAEQQRAKSGDAMAPLVGRVRRQLETAGIAAIDYIAVVDARTLEPLAQLDRPARLCVAVHIDGTRLIDNLPLPAQRC